MEQKIIEGNKAIGKFMGATIFDDKLWFITIGSGKFHDGTTAATFDRVAYHSSWDWQIPAWSKLCHDCQQLASQPGIDHQFYLKMLDKYENAIFQNSPKEGQLILLKLLDWYNTNKQQG